MWREREKERERSEKERESQVWRMGIIGNIGGLFLQI
jgi:hypothetical protein